MCFGISDCGTDRRCNTFHAGVGAAVHGARSTNGAVGLGSGMILERAQKFAIQKCIAAGGNVSGYACSIRYCR
jgi:hypothetical protein